MRDLEAGSSNKKRSLTSFLISSHKDVAVTLKDSISETSWVEDSPDFLALFFFLFLFLDLAAAEAAASFPLVWGWVGWGVATCCWGCCPWRL